MSMPGSWGRGLSPAAHTQRAVLLQYRHEWFLANEKRYESLGIKENRVPEGYPSEATGSTVWDGKELVTQRDWSPPQSMRELSYVY
jgi:hypothetical protein